MSKELSDEVNRLTQQNQRLMQQEANNKHVTSLEIEINALQLKLKERVENEERMREAYNQAMKDKQTSEYETA